MLFRSKTRRLVDGGLHFDGVQGFHAAEKVFRTFDTQHAAAHLDRLELVCTAINHSFCTILRGPFLGAVGPSLIDNAIQGGFGVSEL